MNKSHHRISDLRKSPTCQLSVSAVLQDYEISMHFRPLGYGDQPVYDVLSLQLYVTVRKHLAKNLVSNMDISLSQEAGSGLDLWHFTTKNTITNITKQKYSYGE